MLRLSSPQVTFVGKVLANDTSNNTNVAYKIDDGTGIMDVKVRLCAFVCRLS